jgi:predicted transcriptional regulator
MKSRTLWSEVDRNRAQNMSKRTIEVDDTTANALETRASQVGLSVAESLAAMVAADGVRRELPSADITALDQQWAAIKAGAPTVPHEDVVRWLDTWGTPGFRLWKGQ